MDERHTQSFLAGGDEMGHLIRAHDWGATPLGEPDSWPQALKTVVRILLSTGHPMFLFWGEELIQFYNDAYRRSIGPERHPSALGQRGRECWEEIWDIIGAQIEQVMAGVGHTWHENQLVPITRHGKREDVYWTYSYGPVDEPSAPNGVGGVLVVCTETTAQVESARRLKEAEAGWRALFEQAPGFMAILRGPDHVFEYANDRYRELTGHREIMSRPVREALPEVEQQGFVKLLDRVYKSGEAYSGRTTPVALGEHADKRRRRYLDFVYQPIRDPSGEITGILVEGSDVTDRVLADEALREEQRRKDEFLAMLAHELRNPLSALSNASEVLKRTVEPGSSVKSIGDMMSRQVGQLSRLVDDLLDVSRITSGRIELQKEVLDLGRIIDGAVESQQSGIREKSQSLTVSYPDECIVEADPARLVQAISNVLSNSSKYTPAGGNIGIEARKRDDMVDIEVWDDGAGISPGMLPKVFDMFTQDTRTLDRSHGGLGIGLAIVQKLIQMLGGGVRAESEGVGRGCRITLSIPLAEGPALRNDRQAVGETRSRRILVVDDNADAADSLAQLLKAVGHNVAVTYSADAALQRAGSVDVVLLDIGLPEMNGYEVATRIRSSGCNALMVAVTGYGQPHDIRRALDAGFDAHLVKPVKLDSLQILLQEGRCH